MAGKVYTLNSDYVTVPYGTLRQPGSRTVRAYAEGRTAKNNSALQTANPHPSGTPAYTAWDNGWTDKNSGKPIGHCCV